MVDDLAGKRTGERIQILRERKGLSRPVLVKLAEALAVGDVTVLAGTDMNLGSGQAIPVA